MLLMIHILIFIKNILNIKYTYVETDTPFFYI